MSEVLKRAKAALEAERDEYRRRRVRDTEEIRLKLPRAAELSNEIRRVFLRGMEDALQRRDESALIEAGERSIGLQRELAQLLAENGYDSDALYERPMCRKCGDTGYAATSMCECLREHLDDARGDDLAVLKVHDRTFESFELDIFSPQVEPEWGLSQRENMAGNLAYCRNWAKNFSPSSPNLFLNGGTGQGKTYLCSCIARKVSESGAVVKYTTAISMFNDLEDKRFERGNPDTAQYYQSGLLIIDDLGTEMTTALVQSLLYDIINTRLSTGCKTIINANLTAVQLAGRYMPQICSRLLGEFKQLHFFGPDLRLRK